MNRRAFWAGLVGMAAIPQISASVPSKPDKDILKIEMDIEQYRKLGELKENELYCLKHFFGHYEHTQKELRKGDDAGRRFRMESGLTVDLIVKKDA